MPADPTSVQPEAAQNAFAPGLKIAGTSSDTPAQAPSAQTTSILIPIKDLGVKLDKTLTGHSYGVSSVAFSPDAKTLASGSRDKSVILWDVATGMKLRTLTGPLERVLSVTFSPDRKTLASGNLDNDIILWDVATGAKLKIFITGHYNYVHSISFSPDAKTIASGGEEKTVMLWDVATGTKLRTLTYHNNPVLSVSFSPDGKILASASDDNSVILWDAATGRRLKILTGQTVSFSPDGKTLATGGYDNSVMLWDVATGNELKTFAGHSDSVLSVSFSPDGKTLASGGRDKSIILWDVATGGKLKTLTGHFDFVHAVAFSPDGKFLASGSADNSVKLWDVAALSFKAPLRVVAALPLKTPPVVAAVPLKTPPVENSLIGINRKKPSGDVDEITLYPQFAEVSDVFSEADRSMMDIIVSELKKMSIKQIIVSGHTDSNRIAKRSRHIFADNYALSKGRAKRVASYIMEALNLKPEQFVIAGYGPDKPIATNKSREGRALNRRVELTIVAYRDADL